jgi:hypothetical protein
MAADACGRLANRITGRNSVNLLRCGGVDNTPAAASLHNAQFVLHAQDQAKAAMGGNLDKEKPRQSSSEGKLTIREIDGTPFR